MQEGHTVQRPQQPELLREVVMKQQPELFGEPAVKQAVENARRWLADHDEQTF